MTKTICYVKIGYKKWEILLCEKDNYKFLLAKRKDVYGEIFKVKLHTMYDGTIVACVEDNKIIDSDELTELRREMIAIRKKYC